MILHFFRKKKSHFLLSWFQKNANNNVVGVVRIVRDPPVNFFGKSSSAHRRGRYVPQSSAIMHNANDSLQCCNVKLCVHVKLHPYVKKAQKTHKTNKKQQQVVNDFKKEIKKYVKQKPYRKQDVLNKNHGDN